MKKVLVNYLSPDFNLKANLVGSSLLFSFDIDKSDEPCKGVFSNGSDPLTYLSSELFPLLSSEIPIITIDARCLNNSAAKFYEQFLVPFLCQQKVMDTSFVEISITRKVIEFAIPFDTIFKWLEANALKKRKQFIIFIYSTGSTIPVTIIAEMEAFETQIIAVKTFKVCLSKF